MRWRCGSRHIGVLVVLEEGPPCRFVAETGVDLAGEDAASWVCGVEEPPRK